jgi:hypothetical protein
MMMTRQQLYILIKPRSNLIKPRCITTSRQNSASTPPIAEVIPLYWRHLTWRGHTSRHRNVHPPLLGWPSDIHDPLTPAKRRAQGRIQQSEKNRRRLADANRTKLKWGLNKIVKSQGSCFRVRTWNGWLQLVSKLIDEIPSHAAET